MANQAMASRVRPSRSENEPATFLPRIEALPIVDYMIAYDVLGALGDLKEGRVRLTGEQQTAFLDAVERLVRVLIEAPRGGDSTEIALWYVHDRTPALAQLADAARPEEPSLAAELERTRAEELKLLRELQGNLSR